VKAPGDLVEMDTVHYVNKLNGERKYIFTVIDLCSRMAHARCFDRLLPSGAVKTLAEAEQFFGFPIRTVQTDNGPEFGRWFTDRVQVELLDGDRRVHRHTRIHRPNDNAHIERFNRTLREECIGVHMDEGMTAEDISWELLSYLDHYNNVRIHLGVQCRTPRQQANKTVG
jgi:putative transposase